MKEKDNCPYKEVVELLSLNKTMNRYCSKRSTDDKPLVLRLYIKSIKEQKKSHEPFWGNLA